MAKEARPPGGWPDPPCAWGCLILCTSVGAAACRSRWYTLHTGLRYGYCLLDGIYYLLGSSVIYFILIDCPHTIERLYGGGHGHSSLSLVRHGIGNAADEAAEAVVREE